MSSVTLGVVEVVVSGILSGLILHLQTVDKYGFGVVCRMYWVYSTKPFMLGL